MKAPILFATLALSALIARAQSGNTAPNSPSGESTHDYNIRMGEVGRQTGLCRWVAATASKTAT